MKTVTTFASDNYAGVHPEIIKAITEANIGHATAYGDDEITRRAIAKFKEHFGTEIDVYFVFNGTAANVLGIKQLTQPYNAVICAETAHINVDECAAPERFSGCKLLSVPTSDGKLAVDLVRKRYQGIGSQHHVQPKVISITQSTEFGTVYARDEITALADFAHSHDMYLHMDGARISNAAATLGTGFKSFTRDAGVDVLSFGGTKNGLMIGEAVIFFDQKLAQNFKYVRKQGMQLASKMRFIAAQFEALLSNDLWLRSASHANKMARLLEKELSAVPQIRISQKVESNGVFAIIPREMIPILQERFYFYVWNEETSEARLMTAFDTTQEDVMGFVNFVKQTCLKTPHGAIS